MLTYTFTRREKALLLLLAIVVVVIVWFVFVYQGTTNAIQQMDTQISEMNAEIEADQTRVAMLDTMRSTIEQRKAEGAKTTPMPTYDNIKPLMAELNNVMSDTNNYTLTFDALNRDDDTYVARGVRIDYTCDSSDDAEKIVRELAGGVYPCTIDSVAVSTSRVASSTDPRRVAASSSVHVTFYEKYPEGYVKPSTEEEKKS